MHTYVSCALVTGNELGPEWEVIMASVAKDLVSEIAVRVIAGIRTLNEVEPVSIVI